MILHRSRVVIHLAAAAFALLACGTRSASGQGTDLVWSGNGIYADIDRLSELGVLDSIIVGQRPYSRREIRRIASVARAHLVGQASTAKFDDATLRLASSLLHRIESQSGDRIPADDSAPAFRLLDGASLSFTSTDASRRGFPSSHTRPTEATIDPLASRRLGGQIADGNVGTLELSNRFDLAPWLSVQARERYDYGRYGARGASNHGELLLASARARFGNAALTIGRQQFTWAQAADQGIFLAADAPALDMLTLTADHPFTLPGFLRRVGPTQATLIVADLGPSIARSHSRLVAYKVSVSPNSAMELGAGFGNHFGGAGARSSSATDRLVDLLPFLDVFRRHNYYDSTRTLEVESDKVLLADARARFAALADLTITGELQLEDFDIHRLTDLLTGYGAETINIILPCIGSPAWSVKVSAKHTGIITYTHAQLTNGFSTRGRLLGDELGPDAKSFGAQLRWTPSAAVRVEVEGRSNVYSKAEYGGYYSDSAQVIYNVQKRSSSPSELREIGIASLVLQRDNGIAITLRVGSQRIRNADFAGERRREYVADLALRIGQ